MDGKEQEGDFCSLSVGNALDSSWGRKCCSGIGAQIFHRQNQQDLMIECARLLYR